MIAPFLANKGVVLAWAMGTIIIKASFLQIYIKHLRSLVYNELQTPIKLFPWLGWVMKASPLPGFRAVWRARPHMLFSHSPLWQVPPFYKSCTTCTTTRTCLLQRSATSFELSVRRLVTQAFLVYVYFGFVFFLKKKKSPA